VLAFQAVLARLLRQSDGIALASAGDLCQVSVGGMPPCVG
jgi:hypothetical protein